MSLYDELPALEDSSAGGVGTSGGGWAPPIPKSAGRRTSAGEGSLRPSFRPRQSIIPAVQLKPHPVIRKASHAEDANAGTKRAFSHYENNPPSPLPSPLASPTVENPDQESFDVEDPYDPMVPNSYEEYCRERDAENRRLELIAINKRAEEEIKRRDVERARQLAELANSKTSMSSTVATAAASTRRGISNLPAWLVAMQQQQQQQQEQQGV